MNEKKFSKTMEELASLRIPEFRVRAALGLPPKVVSRARTVEEAEGEYGIASHGSEEQAAALLRWNQLSLEEVERAVDAPQAEDAFHRSPRGSEAEVAGFIIWVRLLSDLTAIKEALDNSPNDKAEAEGIRRFHELLHRS